MSFSTKTSNPEARQVISPPDDSSHTLKDKPLKYKPHEPDPFFKDGSIDTSFPISIINQFFPPDYAATGQLIEELAHNLKGYGYQIRVFTSQPSYAFDRDDSPRVEVFPSVFTSQPSRNDSLRTKPHQLRNKPFPLHSSARERENLRFPAAAYGSLSIRRSQSARFWPERIRGKAVAGAIFFVRTALHLLRHANSREIVLLTTAPPFLPLLGYLLSRIRKIRYVCLLYDLYPDIAVELDVIKKHHWLTKLWDRFNCLTWQQAEAIIVLNETMKDRILAKQPGINDKIHVISNWVDSEQIRPRNKENNWFAQQHGLVEPFTVLYSGNMGRCHDMDTLFEAIILLRDTPIRFVFIGSGDKRKDFQQRAAELGLTNCLFLPYQPRENLPFSLTACDVSIVSISAGMEGLVAPSKLYSALAAGRPIVSICPENSYLNEIFAEAECGITVRNGDSQGLATYLHRLSQNPGLTWKLGQSGREYCLKNYTSAKITKDYQELFQSLVSRQKHSR
jgi:glycosyltransferase involved in cell wall biosynthesis